MAAAALGALTESQAIQAAKQLRDVGYRAPVPIELLRATTSAMRGEWRESSKLAVQGCWGLAWIAQYGAEDTVEIIVREGGLAAIASVLSAHAGRKSVLLQAVQALNAIGAVHRGGPTAAVAAQMIAAGLMGTLQAAHGTGLIGDLAVPFISALAPFVE